MRKTAVSIVLIFVLSCFSAAIAAENPFASDTEWITTDAGAKSVQWHYAPEFTYLDEQGKIETWLKAKCVGPDTQYSKSGEYTIYHILIAPDFEKFINTEWCDFRPDGTLIQTKKITDAKWKGIPHGTDFEKCLQSVASYANSN